ncbi:hypothetical protein [Ralstonia syzygii]|uniref:hypothetical protein n=1 Tax=Ralstonia syzygii TaxID=28097 RepID=UPI00351861F5
MNRFLKEMVTNALCKDGLKITPPSILIVIRGTEMQKTLAEQFAANEGQPITIDGKVVVNMFRRPVKPGQVFDLRFVQGVGLPKQGLRIKVKDGTVFINNQEIKEAIVWKESAPKQLSIECRLKKKIDTSELRIWNCWLDSGGVTQAWTGNAGMIVEEVSDGVTLHCSAGSGDFDPSALEVKLIFAK